MARGSASKGPGSGAGAPQCQWTDDSTLVAQLTADTDAGPGMEVGVLPNVLWPRLWTIPAACAADPCSLCEDAKPTQPSGRRSNHADRN